MKKMTKTLLIAVVMFICLFSTAYAVHAAEKNETLKGESTGRILELKTHELKTMEDYKEKYGSDTYGTTAYILDRVRIYSIPLVFIGIAFSAIYQYIIGIKRLDVRDKGFNSMIAIITIGVICQILPIVFAIVITSAGK